MPRADEMPVLVYINRAPYWQASDGRTFPLVAGAEDPPPDHNTDEDHTEGDDFDKDRALATIRRQRDEAKTLRAQLKELESLKAKERERQDADKSEAEKLRIRLEEAQAKLAERDAAFRRAQVEQVIERMARKHNARKPEHITKLIDHTALTLDDEGNPTNAEDLVKDLLKAEPYLVGKVEATNGVPSTPRPSAPQGHDDRVRDNRAKLAATGDYNPL
jgi:hypothetical protein